MNFCQKIHVNAHFFILYEPTGRNWCTMNVHELKTVVKLTVFRKGCTLFQVWLFAYCIDFKFKNCFGRLILRHEVETWDLIPDIWCLQWSRACICLWHPKDQSTLLQLASQPTSHIWLWTDQSLHSSPQLPFRTNHCWLLPRTTASPPGLRKI